MTTTAKQLTLKIPVRNGRLNPSPVQLLTISGYLAGREGAAVVVAFSKPTTKRSNPQNSYYWGVVLGWLATETGHAETELHEILKQTFLPRKFVKLGNREVQIPKSTTELDTQEFETYLEQVRAWAATDLGIRIPLPNE